MKYILVEYKTRTGEYEHYLKRTFEVQDHETNEEVIHNYFKDYWDETVVDEKANEYHLSNWEQTLQVVKVQEISQDDYAVFCKYSI